MLVACLGAGRLPAADASGHGAAAGVPGHEGADAGDPAGPGQRCHYRACDRAGLPRIGAHRLRHTLATKCDAKIDWKALSKRIGHADVAFTMKQYVQTNLEADRQVASTLA